MDILLGGNGEEVNARGRLDFDPVPNEVGIFVPVITSPDGYPPPKKFNERWDVPPPDHCNCGLPVVLMGTTDVDKKNYGRFFYHCQNFGKFSKCNFFEWVDNYEQKNRYKSRQNHG